MMKMQNKKLISVAIGVICFLVSNCFAMKTEGPLEPQKTEYRIGNVVVRQLHFDEIDSTQRWSSQNIKMSYPIDAGVYMLVTAGKQTAGIGTHNRKWVSYIRLVAKEKKREG